MVCTTQLHKIVWISKSIRVSVKISSDQEAPACNRYRCELNGKIMFAFETCSAPFYDAQYFDVSKTVSC